MKRKVLIIAITILIGWFGLLIIYNFNKHVPKKEIEVPMTSETEVSSTITPTTTKVSKKVSKTTKKKISGFNIKASKSEIQSYAYQRVVQIWGEDHWNSFYQLVSHESGWNPNSVNKKSGACGLFQFVPCSKGGKAYKTDYKVQVEKGINYIKARYGDPNNAWSFWLKYHWY